MKPSTCGICLVASLVAAPAASQSLTRDTLAKFVEESGSQFGEHRPGDWEDALHALAQSDRSPEEVVAAFARTIRVSLEVARASAAVIVESVVDDEACQAPRGRAPQCAFSPGRPFYDRAASAGRADPSGNLLIVVARSPLFTRWDQAAFMTLARSHPAAASIFEAMFDGDRIHLMAAMASGRVTERVAAGASTAESWDFGWSLEDNARHLAMLESLERSAASQKASFDTRAGLAQWALSSKLALGLIDDAVKSYDAYPEAVRTRLPLSLAACQAAVGSCPEAADAGYGLVDQLAAALWTAGRRQEARRLLRAEDATLGPRSPERRMVYEALSDAISLVHRPEDLFSLFIEGHLPDQPPPTSITLVMNGPGWLFTVRSAGIAVRRVVAGRLRAAGHADMADYLEEPDRRRGPNDDPVVVATAAMFPAKVRDRQISWKARLEAAVPSQTTVTATPVRVSTRDLPAWWVERPLPESISRWSDGDMAPEPPEDAKLPVDPDAVVRYEERNGERAIVYLSSEFDMPGETPAFGFWFNRTVGGVWNAPLYLGMQQHYPYVVTAGSRLPLLDGARLRLEVQVREIDPSTVTFPPVSLGLKRSADGLYLEFDLATLAADRDGDGLTDIEERRLGLDFTNPDTDGDGAADGRDPLPLVPYRAVGARDDELARTIVSEVFRVRLAPIVVKVGGAPTIEEMMVGDRSGAAAAKRTRTRFLVGEPSMFAGVATPYRLIVYSQKDMAALNRNGAPFYATRVTYVFSSLDRTRHFVEWSASWTGGAFLVTCGPSPGACSVTEVSSWIT